MLIAREKEQKILSEAYQAEESQFIAVYGRRRVGKTYLIRESMGGRFAFQHTGYYGGKLADELFAFCASLREYGLPDFKRPKNWLEAFELLKELIRRSASHRKVIFLDELSWMDTHGSDFVMALEGFWNGWASARKDILLIICSSVTSWMLSKIIHNKGGMYHRLSHQMHLLTFSLRECETYLQSRNIVMNRHQILECYMIMGGIPFYWSQLENGYSLSQNIDRIFFAKDAPLAHEFNHLYPELFKKPAPYISIVSALGRKKAGMTREELLEATHMPDSGNFTLRLQELESCGFIRKYLRYGMKERYAVYQLIDNFTLFYYSFLEHKPSDEHYCSNQINTPQINAWCGSAFERVCLEHISQMKQALGISGVLSEAYSWSCKEDTASGVYGSQIDLMIVRRDQVINLCEMKYAGKKYAMTAKVDEEIRRKIVDFQTVTGARYAIHPTLVTPYGLADGSYAGSVQNVITTDDLFS
ncbi:MAG: ATP-binding protein [Clostridia bacterium]|nr:ATP-binding protein [Clostridia bacterium]MBR1684864.1 ATP-binding protein [Clostridia bacterium]MBR2287661.1 ATP-binding protein [Clostridia bacterium]